MSVRSITAEQYADRIEWLSSAAGFELQQASADGHEGRLREALDRIKQAAAECAKFRREGLIHDRGGTLTPGLVLAVNDTGKPESIRAEGAAL